MGFWKFGASSDDEERKRVAASVREAELERQRLDVIELERGGIPVQAKARLIEMGANANSPDSIFTSDLAPDEMALLRREGYRPRGLLTGSAMFHVGKLYVAVDSDCEIMQLSEAYNRASELAVNRMNQELQLIGAHGIVGVRMTIARHEWAEKTIEVQLVGTAVDCPGTPPSRPWMSDLSAQEWFALRRAGYEPVGLVWGHCAWWLYTSYSDEVDETSWQNIEMTHWSQGLSQARHLALSKIQSQTKNHGGHGIVGVKIERRLDRMHLYGANVSEAAKERLHHNLLLSIIGTAVRASGKESHMVRQTVPVLSLRDGRMKPMVLKQRPDFKVED